MNQIKSNEDHAKHYEARRILERTEGAQVKPWDELNGFEKRQYIENVEAQLKKDQKELLEASAPAMTDEPPLINEKIKKVIEELKEVIKKEERLPSLADMCEKHGAKEMFIDFMQYVNKSAREWNDIFIGKLGGVKDFDDEVKAEINNAKETINELFRVSSNTLKYHAIEVEPLKEN